MFQSEICEQIICPTFIKIYRSQLPSQSILDRKKYIGIDLDRNYEKGEVKLSMKGYVEKALKDYQHKPPPKPVNWPTPYTAPIYWKSVQHATIEEGKH